MRKITEEPSLHRDLEKKSTRKLLEAINTEDRKVAEAVSLVIPTIEQLVESTYPKMEKGGRLFYIGAGTSGRLGVLDASECPPTYGVPDDWVVGLIAGGDIALRRSIEHAEDSHEQAWIDLAAYKLNELDTLVGIAASGTTPYVVHGLKKAQENAISTACITCNPNTPVSIYADYPIVVVVGPEFVTGSTRMKSGTAQKLVLNMISTSIMIKLGRVKDNRMVDMQLANDKLWKRGIKMIQDKFPVSDAKARTLLEERKSVRAVLDYLQNR